MAKLTVLEQGLFTTVQDIGRPGYRKYGVPVSGVMDEPSFRLANQLVGNPEHYPVLELTLKGGVYLFEEEAVIAISGADMSARLNEEEVPVNQRIHVNRGDQLKLSYAVKGCRCYLAVRGLMDLQPVMGSYSTYTTGRFGGLEGRSLKAGDTLSWKEGEIKKTETVKHFPDLEAIHTIRIMKGPEWDWLTEKAKKDFLSHEFQISSQSNRMGISLESEGTPAPDQQMKSSPVVPGIIQLPPGGQPILLMKDGQTVGGYPRIAKVRDAELWKAAQLKPGAPVRFNLDP